MNSGIQLYCRYHDDILWISKSKETGHQFFKRLADCAAKCYTIKLDETSARGVYMLDLFIFKAREGGRCRLQYMPYVKPTANHIPLGQSSEHSVAIHRSWPPAEIQRMHGLSFHRYHFEEFRDLKCDRFRQFAFEKNVLLSCENWKPKIPSSICKAELGCIESVDILRVVVPYNRYIAHGIKSVCGQIQENVNLLLRGIAPRLKVEVSFKNACEPLHISLRKVNSA